MALQIIPPTQAITVAHPKLLIYGPAGIGKSTLKNMTRDLVTADFDEGAHRELGRQMTVRCETWEDVDELLGSPLVAQCKTFGTDTLGRALDLITDSIARTKPKLAPGGVLTQQGWGELKNRFKGFKNRLEHLGKDVVWIAHEKEEKDGEVRILRPDVQGGSLSEVLKSCDLIGILYKEGKERILSFEPSERWVAKGPEGWGRIVIPQAGLSPTFLSDLLDKAREELGRVSAESDEIAKKVADWHAKIDAATVEELTAIIPVASALEPPMLKAQVRELVARKAAAEGWKWDKATSAYLAPAA